MLRSQGPLTHLNCCHVMSLQELRDWLRSNASEVTATSAVFREKSTEVMSSIPCVFLLHPWPHGGSYLVNGVVMEVGKERPIRSGRHWGGGRRWFVSIPRVTEFGRAIESYTVAPNVQVRSIVTGLEERYGVQVLEVSLIMQLR